MRCAALILACREALVVYTALKYNFNHPWVMSFHLEPHLPRLVAVVAKSERKVSNLIYFFSYFIFINFFYINKEVKQHRMPRSRPVITSRKLIIIIVIFKCYFSVEHIALS